MFRRTPHRRARGTVPDSFQALTILFLAVFPGAVFVYALERMTGAWGIKATDRILRFVVLSTVLLVLAVPYAYTQWRRFILSDHIASGHAFPWSPYLVALGYLVVLPALAGTLVGWAMGSGHRWPGRLFGHQVTAPRAFDYLFGGERNGYVRILLKVDPPRWVAGAYVTVDDNNRGYVAGYPESPDIYLPVQLECDEASGAFEFDEHGDVIPRERSSLLVDGGSIAYLEFIDG
jgi:hypothetical protein